MFLDFAFNVEGLLSTLPVMGKGMLGIFTVTGVIILSIYALEKFTSNKEDNDKGSDI